ncbi:hypothetical protein GGI12_000647 [Dipsacomyces acuminosporus]|nr:hypothetical protein GGI12_000647 [Dipsacomyces acuminosporus]
MAAAQAAGGIFYIPSTTIDNTEAYYDDVSRNWASVRGRIEHEIEGLAHNKDYGPYVLMTSIYGHPLPTNYDERYVHSLMQKIQDIGPRTWDDVELQSISSTYQIAHQSAYIVSAAPSKQAQRRWYLVALVLSGTAVLF